MIARLRPVVAGMLLLGCAHEEPHKICGTPGPVVGPRIHPCPTGLVTRTVREVLAQKWPHGACFAVRGHLTAAYGVFGHGWVLTDLRDPFTSLRADKKLDAQPTISLMTAGTNEASLQPLQRCNQGDDGNPLMPAGTRLELPAFEPSEAAWLNDDVGIPPVAVFGGKDARDMNPEDLDRFDTMVVTHVCFLDLDELPDAGAQARD